MIDAVRVLVQHRRRLTVAFYRTARESEVGAWDFTDMQWSGALEQVTRLDPRPSVVRPQVEMLLNLLFALGCEATGLGASGWCEGAAAPTN